MNWNTWLPFILIILLLVFCVGPMLFKRGRHGKGEGQEKDTAEKTGKPANEGEPK